MSCAKEDDAALIQQLTMDIDSDSDSDSEIKPVPPPQIDAPSVRPQIIVTPRKVAAAIESVKADVLAKNNKTSLFECVPADSAAHPLSLPANAFAVFDMNSGASTSSGSVASGAGEGSSSSVIAQGGSSASGSPSKSVIVRAGPSVCRKLRLINTPTRIL